MNKRNLSILGSMIFVGALAFSSMPETQAVSAVVPAGKHCVAWKTKKTLGLVKRVEPVGMSCSATIKAVKAGANLSAEVTVPIASFDSGEKKRDSEVLKILQANVAPNLVYQVDPLPAATWQAMLKNGSGPVRGTLSIAGKTYPLSTTAKVRKSGGNIEVYGTIITKFSSLGIKPPMVGPGGSIAKVDDYLELHFNFLSGKVINKGIVPNL